MTQPRQKMFNVPPVMLATLAVLGLVHLARIFLLSPRGDLNVLLLFAFIPGRYETGLLPSSAIPGGLGASIWTFVSYAFLHSDFIHLGVNCVWLLAFGTPLARRFGAWRFVAFLLITAAAGAAAHLLMHANEFVPMIGASASVSGAMAATMRFAFQRGGPLVMRANDDASYRVPAVSLTAALSDPRILAFLAVWFGINLIFGLGSISITGADQSIAWEAHVGGFLAGLLLFGLFDPIPLEEDRNITIR